MLAYADIRQSGYLADKGLGAFEPKAKRAPKGEGPSGWLCPRRGREWPFFRFGSIVSKGKNIHCEIEVSGGKR